jgi:hypothetical protein
MLKKYSALARTAFRAVNAFKRHPNYGCHRKRKSPLSGLAAVTPVSSADSGRVAQKTHQSTKKHIQTIVRLSQFIILNP